MKEFLLALSARLVARVRRRPPLAAAYLERSFVIRILLEIGSNLVQKVPRTRIGRE